MNQSIYSGLETGCGLEYSKGLSGHLSGYLPDHYLTGKHFVIRWFRSTWSFDGSMFKLKSWPMISRFWNWFWSIWNRIFIEFRDEINESVLFKITRLNTNQISRISRQFENKIVNFGQSPIQRVLHFWRFPSPATPSAVQSSWAAVVRILGVGQSTLPSLPATGGTIPSEASACVSLKWKFQRIPSSWQKAYERAAPAAVEL